MSIRLCRDYCNQYFLYRSLQLSLRPRSPSKIFIKPRMLNIPWPPCSKGPMDPNVATKLIRLCRSPLVLHRASTGSVGSSQGLIDQDSVRPSKDAFNCIASLMDSDPLSDSAISLKVSYLAGDHFVTEYNMTLSEAHWHQSVGFFPNFVKCFRVPILSRCS